MKLLYRCCRCRKLALHEICYMCLHDLTGLLAHSPVKLWAFADYLKWQDSVDEEKKTLLYVMGLTEEAGEVAGKFKKLHRDHGGVLTEELRKGILTELGDVFYYWSRLVKRLNSSPTEVTTFLYEKLESRRQRGTLHGSGDNR